ncbi:restriction endonuclease subunit S [Elizabethkingia meningoseptica]|uniref:restriction endonuclease subunit S n=1 Tax=Elizabethkingia meningoseptica TaxID=238 RepID=UPI0030180F33
MTEKNKSVKKFPNLRFPGFDEEWENKKLGEIATFSKGKGISKNEIVDNGETECIRYGELYTFYEEVISQIQSKTNTDISSLVLSEANDVIIPASGETQIDIATASCVLKSGVALGGDLNIIKTKNNGVFLSYYLNSKKKLEIAKLSQGISVVHLYSSQLALLNLKLPQFEEQKKLANFLSLLNSRIQTQKKIISQLKSQMSNLKDLIFEQQLRFKNDKENEFPDWKGSKLEDICEKKSSNISANKIEDNVGNYPIYGATGILKSIDFYEVENDYVSIIKDGAGVGRLIYCKGKSSVLGTLDIIQSKNVNLYFIFLLLSRIDFKKYITGSTIPHIYFKDYKKENFQIPSIKEQEKIANFFKLLDDKINTESSLLIQYENQKKYLLQNLFV